MRYPAALSTVVAAVIGVTLAVPANASPGALDPTFGSGGIAPLPFHAVNLGHSVAVQRDSKIVMVGNTFRFTNVVVSRLTTTGQPDPTFGSGGSVNVGKTNAQAYGVAIDSAGRAVIVYTDQVPGSNSQLEVCLARFRTNGSRDPTFGAAGRVCQRPLNGNVQLWPVGLAIQTVHGRERIVVAGSVTGQGDYAVKRFNTDGTVDRTFGTGGLAVGYIPAYGPVEAVAVQADGKIVLSGGANTIGFTDYSVALVRFTSGGRLDPTFGVGGHMIDVRYSSISPQGWDVAISPNGRINVVASPTYADPYRDDFTVSRYLPNGLPDRSFGDAGRVITDMGGLDYILGLVSQPDGKLVVAGVTIKSGGPYDIALARYLANGRLDPTFGDHGRVVTPGNHGGASAVALSGHRIVAVSTVVTKYLGT